MNKKKFKVPHTFVLLFAIIVLATIATYIVPSGVFDRIKTELSWRPLIVAGSYHSVEASPVGPFKMFIDIFKGFLEAANIIFFIFIAYSYVYLISKTGAIAAMSGWLLKRLQGKEKMMIPIFMVFFGITGSTYGMFESAYGLIPIFVGLAIALGYDAIVGMSMVGLAAATGFASATTNPFTVGVAQTIAGVPLFSGLGFRVVIFIAFQIVAIWYVMRYAAKIKKNPEMSLVKDIDYGEMILNKDFINANFSNKHKLLLLGFVFTVVMLVLGGLKLHWGLNEMAALFLVMALVSGGIAGYGPSKIAITLLEGCSAIVFGALVVGVARAILVVMNDGNILDSIIYALSEPLQHLPSWATAQGMVVVQNIINFFIPSGSGQAATTMPILAPLAGLVGVSKQVAVLAYQFGDGYSNMIWPTAGCVVMCAVAKIPYERWFRFFAPLFGILFLMQMGFMAVATMIGY